MNTLTGLDSAVTPSVRSALREFDADRARPMTLRPAGTAMLVRGALALEPASMAMPELVRWTRADLDRLPDDGNRYEVLNGELLVTPAPSTFHQEIVAWLNAKLLPFVVANALGRVYHPRSVIVVDGSQLEPDMMVRPIAPFREWEDAPLPILVIEVLSKGTRRRDLEVKRDFYVARGIPEYWAVDRYDRVVMRFTTGASETVKSVLTWKPRGTTATLEIDVAAMFAETLRSE